MKKFLANFLFLIATSALVQAQTIPAKDLMNKMVAAMDNIKTARYGLQKQERIGKKMVQSDIIVKLNASPTKIYVYSVSPNPGAEALYVRGENNNNVAVSANKFPYVTLNMSPHNSLLRANQHHTILDIGFSYLNSILKSYIATKGDGFYSWLTNEGLIDYKGKQYYKLIIDNKGFGFSSYEVKKGETLTSIASRLNISDYMTLTLNPQCTSYDDVRKGQKIKVPNSYAKRIVLYVEKNTFLPLVQFIYDDKGLFENYELSSFILNPTFQPAEFTTTYKDYHF